MTPDQASLGRNGASPPEATVFLSTHNRREELGRAVASALAQTAHTEVIVIDDGSTDGTAEYIAREFPQVRLHRSDTSRGYIVQRNAGAAMARAPFIFSLDDDAVFTSPDTVAHTLAEFARPCVGAVAIPFLDVNQPNATVRQCVPSLDREWAVPAFIGTAHALRKSVFLAQGGYRESLYHQGEESDYCLRMLAAGYVTRLGTAEPIHHFESPRRDFRRMDIYGRRNNVLFGWHHAPSVFLPAHLVATSVNGMIHGMKTGRVPRTLQGLAVGYAGLWPERHQRRPVSVPLYRLYRELVRRKVVPLEELEERLQTLVARA